MIPVTTSSVMTPLLLSLTLQLSLQPDPDTARLTVFLTGCILSAL